MRGNVLQIDRAPRPLGFVDGELLDRFVASFEARPGCTFLGCAAFTSVAWDGVGEVVTTLENGWEVRSQKLLCALGRVANVEDLGIDAAGLRTSARGHLEVDEDCMTSVPGVYAVGDVIGPPSLASASLEQGRRAVRAAINVPAAQDREVLP